MPDYEALREAGTTDVGTGRTRLQSFAGQAEDPFFLDLRVFDLLYGGDLSEAGDDTLAGFNVNSVALQVPRRMLADDRNVDREPDHRRLVDHRPSGRGRPLPPGLAPGHAAGQRGRHPGRGQGQVQRLRSSRRRSVPRLRHQARASEGGRGRLRLRGSRGAAQRPGLGLPDRSRGSQPARRGHPQRAAEAQHGDAGDGGPRTGWVRSRATTRASRTVDGSATTSSTSRCRRPRVLC